MLVRRLTKAEMTRDGMIKEDKLRDLYSSEKVDHPYWTPGCSSFCRKPDGVCGQKGES
jgi:hypothetical protein